MWARCVTVSGPPEALYPDQALVVSQLQKHFQRQDGFLGSALLIDEKEGAIRSMGFWATREALEETDGRAASLGQQMAQSIWGVHGNVDTEVFEVLSLKPPPAVDSP